MAGRQEKTGSSNALQMKNFHRRVHHAIWPRKCNRNFAAWDCPSDKLPPDGLWEFFLPPAGKIPKRGLTDGLQS